MNDVLSFALKKLASRPYSREELQNTLLKAGISLEETELVIQKLLEMGYINDRGLAQDLYHYYTQLKPCGRKVMKQKLLIKGLSPEIIEETLEKFNQEKERELALLLTKKYFSQHKTKANIHSLARFLQAKGFTEEIIINIITTISPDLEIYLD